MCVCVCVCVQVTNFYDYAGEPEEGEDLKQWILREQDRGAIRFDNHNANSNNVLLCYYGLLPGYIKQVLPILSWYLVLWTLLQIPLLQGDLFLSLSLT